MACCSGTFPCPRAYVNVYDWDAETLEKYKALKTENELVRRWGLMLQRIEVAKDYCNFKKNNRFRQMWEDYVEPEASSAESINRWRNESWNVEIQCDNRLDRFKKLLYEEYSRYRRKPLTLHGEVISWTNAALSSSSVSTSTEVFLSASEDESDPFDETAPSVALGPALDETLGQEMMLTKKMKVDPVNCSVSDT